MKMRTALIIMLMLIGLYSAHVFFWEPDLSQIVSGVYITALSCVAASYYTYAKVRARLLGGVRAIILVLLCSIAGAIIPLLIMGSSERYYGENALSLVPLALFAFGFCVANVLFFAIVIFQLYMQDDT